MPGDSRTDGGKRKPIVHADGGRGGETWETGDERRGSQEVTTAGPQPVAHRWLQAHSSTTRPFLFPC